MIYKENENKNHNNDVNVAGAAADEAEYGVDVAATREEGCEYSDWSEWSPCSKTCGNDGVQERQRSLLPVNGQLPTTCGATLRLRRRMCSNLPPCDAARRTVSVHSTKLV